MLPSLLYSDFEFVLGLKRQFLHSIRAVSPAVGWRTHLRRFFQALERLATSERGAALALLVTAAEETRHLVQGRQDYRAALEAALASSEIPMLQVLQRVESELAAMVGRPVAGRRSDRVGSVVEIIDRRYAEPLTIEQLARQVCRERGHIASQFRRETGFTIHRYLTYVRIRHATELLNGGEKVEAVMLLVGYRSKKSFYKQFRAHTGLTPGSYRVTSS